MDETKHINIVTDGETTEMLHALMKEDSIFSKSAYYRKLVRDEYNRRKLASQVVNVPVIGTIDRDGIHTDPAQLGRE